MKAYELVIRKDDWLRPINRQGNKWKTKANWMLAEQYFRAQDGEHNIIDADDEVTEKLKHRALFAKHPTGAQDAAPVAASG